MNCPLCGEETVLLDLGTRNERFVCDRCGWDERDEDGDDYDDFDYEDDEDDDYP